jgi:hypothetical protein
MPSKKNSTTNVFPVKLHSLLENAEKRGYDNIVSWQEGGNSFKVWQPEVFTKSIMPKYFRQTKLKSFQRQSKFICGEKSRSRPRSTKLRMRLFLIIKILMFVSSIFLVNIYGWKRIGTGKNRGGYFHPSFIQSVPELCLLLKRTPLASKQCGADISFADSTPIPLAQNNAKNSSPAWGGHVTPLLGMNNHYSMFPENDQLQKDESTARCFSSYMDQQYRQQSEDPSGGIRGLDTFGHTQNRMPREFVGEKGQMSEDMHLFADIFSGQDFEMDHDDTSLDNFFTMTPVLSSTTLAGSSVEAPGACEKVFPLKLHFLLEQAEKEGFDHIVSWVNDGASFKVHDSKAFLEKVMPNYFSQSKYESFRRQLNLYGFRRISKGSDMGVYYHQFFMRSEPSLCHSISRPAAMMIEISTS